MAVEEEEDEMVVVVRNRAATWSTSSCRVGAVCFSSQSISLFLSLRVWLMFALEDAKSIARCRVFPFGPSTPFCFIVDARRQDLWTAADLCWAESRLAREEGGSALCRGGDWMMRREEARKCRSAVSVNGSALEDKNDVFLMI
jgi:hypothetical protein